MAAQPVLASCDVKGVTWSDGKSATEEVPNEPSLSKEDFARNPFVDPEVEARYRLLYEKSQYECRHVLDATLEWSNKEERKVVRKLDWHVCTWAVSKVSGVRQYCKTTDSLQISVSCFSLFKWTEKILVKQFRIICWTNLVFLPMVSLEVSRSFIGYTDPCRIQFR